MEEDHFVQPRLVEKVSPAKIRRRTTPSTSTERWEIVHCFGVKLLSVSVREIPDTPMKYEKLSHQKKPNSATLPKEHSTLFFQPIHADLCQSHRPDWKPSTFHKGLWSSVCCRDRPRTVFLLGVFGYTVDCALIEVFFISKVTHITSQGMDWMEGSVPAGCRRTIMW